MLKYWDSYFWTRELFFTQRDPSTPLHADSANDFFKNPILTFRVFANAETLFYYTAFARPTKKLLSLEEIMRLLAQATDQPEVQDGDVRRNVTIVHGGEENQTNVEEMTVTEVDGEEPEGNGLDRDRMVGNDTGMPQQETETGFPREGTIEARQEESYVVGQEMLLQDIMEGEIPEINSTHHDDAQCHDDDGDRQASANFESYLQTDDEVEVIVMKQGLS